MKKKEAKNIVIDNQQIDNDIMYDCELYVIFDRISHKYSSPLPFQNKQLAIRYFDSLLANCDNVRTKASDYELYSLGFYDTTTANLLPISLGFVKAGEDISEVDNGKSKE